MSYKKLYSVRIFQGQKQDNENSFGPFDKLLYFDQNNHILLCSLQIHTVVIETYAKQKDRQALTNYKMALNPQSEDYILVENTLRDNVSQNL